MYPAAIGVVLAGLAPACPAALGETIGSPLLRRQYTDIDLGQVYIYQGSRGGFQASGNVSSWAFFDDRNAGPSVTPLLFRVTTGNNFVLTGIGKSRASAGTGLQRFSFDLVAGRAEVRPGEYTFGFANQFYDADRANSVLPNTGVVGFDRPSAAIPNDPWMVTAAISSGGPVSLQIGNIFGTGGIRIYNAIDPGGLDRVYSAQATVIPGPDSLFPDPIILLSCQASGGYFHFSFQSAEGRSYTVQRNTNLATAEWVFYTNFVSDGSFTHFLVPVAAGPNQFFRVVQP